MYVCAQSGLLSPKDIQTTWVGKTMVGTVGTGPAAGKPIEFTMNLDGTTVLAGVSIDTGTWRLSESGYCVTWEKLRSGQERCFTIIRKGTDYLVNNPDGSLSATITELR
jgi:hypothetical protein